MKMMKLIAVLFFAFFLALPSFSEGAPGPDYLELVSPILNPLGYVSGATNGTGFAFTTLQLAGAAGQGARSFLSTSTENGNMTEFFESNPWSPPGVPEQYSSPDPAFSYGSQIAYNPNINQFLTLFTYYTTENSGAWITYFAMVDDVQGNWTTSATLADLGFPLNTVWCVNGVFIACLYGDILEVGNTAFLTSEDGVTWTQHSYPDLGDGTPLAFTSVDWMSINGSTGLVGYVGLNTSSNGTIQVTQTPRFWTTEDFTNWDVVYAGSSQAPYRAAVGFTTLPDGTLIIQEASSMQPTEYGGPHDSFVEFYAYSNGQLSLRSILSTDNSSNYYYRPVALPNGVGIALGAFVTDDGFRTFNALDHAPGSEYTFGFYDPYTGSIQALGDFLWYFQPTNVTAYSDNGIHWTGVEYNAIRTDQAYTTDVSWGSFYWDNTFVYEQIIYNVDSGAHSILTTDNGYTFDWINLDIEYWSMYNFLTPCYDLGMVFTTQSSYFTGIQKTLFYGSHVNDMQSVNLESSWIQLGDQYGQNFSEAGISFAAATQDIVVLSYTTYVEEDGQSNFAWAGLFITNPDDLDDPTQWQMPYSSSTSVILTLVALNDVFYLVEQNVQKQRLNLVASKDGISWNITAPIPKNCEDPELYSLNSTLWVLCSKELYQVDLQHNKLVPIIESATQFYSLNFVNYLGQNYYVLTGHSSDHTSMVSVWSTTGAAKSWQLGQPISGNEEVSWVPGSITSSSDGFTILATGSTNLAATQTVMWWNWQANITMTAF